MSDREFEDAVLLYWMAAALLVSVYVGLMEAYT